jgi:hypothetical protein
MPFSKSWVFFTAPGQNTPIRSESDCTGAVRIAKEQFQCRDHRGLSQRGQLLGRPLLQEGITTAQKLYQAVQGPQCYSRNVESVLG